MKTFLVHPTTMWDSHMDAKPGLEDLLNRLPDHSNVIELDMPRICYRYLLGASYLSHNGKRRPSEIGKVPFYTLMKLKEKKESEFILAGGRFGQCHKRAFRSLFKSLSGNMTAYIPVQALYYSPDEREIPKTEEYFLNKVEEKYLKKKHLPSTAVYFDEKEIKPGTGKCTIHFFSTNEKLLEHLK